jgi:hypothetical protein
METAWYEVWADEGQDVPYLLLLRPSASGFEVLDPRRHLVCEAGHEGRGFTVERQAGIRGCIERHGVDVDALGAHGLKEGPSGRSAQREEYGLARERSAREGMEEGTEHARIAVLLGALVARSKRPEHRPEGVEQKGRPEGMTAASVQSHERTNELLSLVEGQARVEGKGAL